MTDSNFTFEHRGATITFERSLDEIRSPKFLRQNRRRDELDLTFTIVEDFGGVDVVAAVDDMDEDEFKAFAADLDAAIGASLGK